MRRLLYLITWEGCAMIYLAIPVLIFSSFWLRAPYSLISAILISIGVGCYLWIMRDQTARVAGISVRYIAITLAICIVLAILSGAGGFVWQKPDWAKHNVILNDLIDFPWPVYYGETRFAPDTTLVYYLGYYLPSALVGKFLGWRIGEVSLFLWTVIGLWVFAQLTRRMTRWSPHQFLLFFAMSGADILGIIATQVFSPHPLPFLQIEQYANGLQFSSAMTQLTWVPQHAISGWIGTMLGLRALQKDRSVHTLPLLVCVTAFWSPFVAIGLALLFIPVYLTKNARTMIGVFSIISVLPLAVVCLLYYRSTVPSTGSLWDLYLLAGSDILGNIGLYIAFLILDLFVLGVIVLFVWRSVASSMRRVLIWSFVLLCLIPLIRFARGPDFVMRASIPALTVVFITVAHHLHTIFLQRRLVIAVSCGIMFLCLTTPIVEVASALIPHPHAVNERPIYPMPDAYTRYHVLNRQYLGVGHALFGTYIGNYPPVR